MLCDEEFLFTALLGQMVYEHTAHPIATVTFCPEIWGESLQGQWATATTAQFAALLQSGELCLRHGRKVSSAPNRNDFFPLAQQSGDYFQLAHGQDAKIVKVHCTANGGGELTSPRGPSNK